MVDIPGPPEPPDGGGDSLARRELEFLTAKPEIPELAESERRKILELIKVREVLFWGMRWFIRSAVIFLIGAIFVWWWHLIGPSGYRWLAKEEVTNLQAIISSGAIAALVTAIGKKIL